MPDLVYQKTAKAYGNSSIRIVLVEPAGGLNVGAIARVMKNMGLSHLTLVNPKCDPQGEDALRMAVHADDVLTAATIVETVPDALHGCRQVVATTARDRDLSLPVDIPKVGLQWLLEQSLADNQTPLAVGNAPSKALLFGPEARGLSNAELIYAQRLITIPTNPAYASLNLAQAVALCCYELRQMMSPELFNMVQIPFSYKGASKDDTKEMAKDNNIDSADVASIEMLEGYYQQLETILLDIGYLYPHTAKSRMEKFRLMFNRSQLSPNEVAMLRGVLRQIEWAIQTASTKTGH
ncbi:MAG: RNA methyltransferase [Cyanobacteria bacterium P01_F01_bin.150]